MPALADLLRAARCEAGATALERLIYGTDDADTAAASLVDWCRDAFGVEVADGVFFVSSVGCVHGVELTDGRQVVVKAFQPNFGAGYLSALQDLQTALADAGLPAPRPLVAPRPLGAGLATAETMLPRPASADGHDPAVRRVLAASLAGFIRLTAAFVGCLEFQDHPFNPSDGDALWPRVHDPRFDFAATCDGAEWIDRLARDALDRRGTIDGPNVVGHLDWRVQNVGIADGELTAIYDWDSVAIDQEPAIAARAAYGHCHDWSIEPPALGTVDEMFAFVADYERARGAAFTTSERALVEAELVYSSAYGARCEHSDDRMSGETLGESVERETLRARLIMLGRRLGLELVGEPDVGED